MHNNNNTTTTTTTTDTTTNTTNTTSNNNDNNNNNNNDTIVWLKACSLAAAWACICPMAAAISRRMISSTVLRSVFRI